MNKPNKTDKMKQKTTVHLISTWLMIFTFILTLVSCSDDSPNPNPNPDSDWHSELYTDSTLVYAGDPNNRPTGLNYKCFAVNIMIKNDEGSDMLNIYNPKNVINSDYYFKFGENIYHLNDTVNDLHPWFYTPYTKKNRTVSINPDFWGKKHMLQPFFFYPMMSDISDFTEPMDITFDFIWPEKKIKKNIRVYFKANENFEEDKENAEIDSKGFKYVPYYQYGIWVDGKSTEGKLDILITI